MKNEKLIKIIKLILIPILIIYGISLSIIYNIFGYGHYLLDSENRRIYGTVCKNMDFRYQKLDSLTISGRESGNNIHVQVKEQIYPVLYFPLMMFGFGVDSDIDRMFKMYEELSVYNKPVSISIGAVGSSNYHFRLSDGCLTFKEKDEESAYALKTAMSRNYVTELVILLPKLNELTKEELPENYSIKRMFCGIDPRGDLNISKFKGLQTLNLRVAGLKGDVYFNLDFINDMPELETLVLHWYADRFDFSDETKYIDVKKVILYTDTYTEDTENLFHNAFPNAEIEIVGDSFPNYYYFTGDY